MLVISKNGSSKVFHYENCGYVKQMSENNKLFFEKESEARAAGYHKCSCCCGIKRRYNKEKSQILNFSQKENIKVEVTGEAIDIDTSIASWRIITMGARKRLILLHSNNEVFRACVKKDGKVIHQYHMQDIGRSSIMGYLRYIVSHDNWKLTNMSKSYKSMPCETKKQKKAYNKAKKRDKKRAANMVCNIIERLQYEEQMNFGQSNRELSVGVN